MTGASSDSPVRIRVVRAHALKPVVSSGSMSRVAGVAADTVGSEHIYMGLSRVPAGEQSSGHVHTNCESALYVVAGRGRFMVGPRLDQGLAVEPGDFIHIPPNAPHAVVNDGADDLVLVVARNAQVEQVRDYQRDGAGK